MHNMKTMCPTGYYQNGFVATQALGHMMYVVLLPSYYICICMIDIDRQTLKPKFPFSFYFFKLLLCCRATQPAITCSKVTIETLEQGVNLPLVSLLLTLNIFHTLFWCFYY